jgi:erythromycin esterase
VLTTFTTPPVREGSLDALLSANAPPLSVLDLRTARGEARQWLTSIQTAHTIAEHYAVANDAAYYARLRPLETFDGIVFVKDTTASHLRTSAEDKLASAEAGRWMKASAVPLKTAEAGNGFDDLAAVGEMAGNARVVALGEATHGTREFFQLKHRILEYLVAKKGFTIFGIEASFPDALAVNDYVLHGTGDPGAALAGLQFWTWNTDEVLDMIKWMRAWNADPAHTAKVQFLGFDMQNPEASVRKLREYFTANDIDAAEALKKRDVKMLTTLLDAHKANTREWELAREEVRLLEQGVEVMGAKGGADSGARDRYMAENVTWILDHAPAGAKMVLWAHNGHVQNRDAAELPSWTPTGAVLRKTYGDALVIFGFAFDRGEFQAMKAGGGGLQKMTVPPAAEGSLDALLAANAPPIAALDLRTSRGAARQWLNEEQRTRSVGAVFDPAHADRYYVRERPLVSYDALLFVAQTTAARGRGARVPFVMPPPDPKALNLSFDEGKPGEPPPGWKNNSLATGYRALVVSEGCVSGTCVKVSRDAEQTREGFGVLMQRVDATPFRGKKIRFRASIRSDIPPGASARLWLRVDRPKGVMGMLDNMGDRLPGALPQWTELETHGEVAPDAEAIAFGLLFTGDGTAWMDDAVLEVVP